MSFEYPRRAAKGISHQPITASPVAPMARPRQRRRRPGSSSHTSTAPAMAKKPVRMWHDTVAASRRAASHRYRPVRNEYEKVPMNSSATESPMENENSPARVEAMLPPQMVQ